MRHYLVLLILDFSFLAFWGASSWQEFQRKEVSVVIFFRCFIVIPFFFQPKKVTVIFPMRFKDDSDVILATSFFQVGSLQCINASINIVSGLYMLISAKLQK